MPNEVVKNFYHVCFTAPSLNPVDGGRKLWGGAEIQIMLLGKKLIENGQKVTIVTQDHGQKDLEVINKINIIKGPLNFFGGSKVSMPFDTIKLYKLFNKINADVYFVRSPAILQVFLGIYCRLSGKPLVRMVASDPSDESGVSRFQLRLIKWSARFVNHTIFQNESQQEKIIKYLKGSSNIIRSIKHANMDKTPDNIQENIDVLWVGGFQHIKRPELIVDLAKRMPDVKFCVVSKNDAASEFLSTYEAMRKQPNLRFAGFVSYDDIPGYFHGAKMLVSTSRLEGFPNVFIQAWQAGKPVLSLQIDPDMVIKDNNIGIVSADLEEMENNINRLLNGDFPTEEYKRRALDYIEREHSETAVLGKLLAVIEKVVR